mgnify:CR=1 FL=1
MFLWWCRISSTVVHRCLQLRMVAEGQLKVESRPTREVGAMVAAIMAAYENRGKNRGGWYNMQNGAPQ